MKRIALIVIRVIWRLPYWWGYKVNSINILINILLMNAMGLYIKL